MKAQKIILRQPAVSIECSILFLKILFLSIYMSEIVRFLDICVSYGARGRTRTDTRLPLPDFESGASTGFTTRAN